jgi:hypothetical protein
MIIRTVLAARYGRVPPAACPSAPLVTRGMLVPLASAEAGRRSIMDLLPLQALMRRTNARRNTASLEVRRG